MLIMEKKEYIIEARQNEILNGQILTEENIENFMSRIIEYFNIWVSPYRCSISEHQKNKDGKFIFKLVAWEDSGK